MKLLTLQQLNYFRIGVAMLSSGGGGDPDILCPLLREMIAKNGPVPVYRIDELDPKDLIVPIAFVGAPLAFNKKSANLTMFACVLEAIKKDHPDKRIILMSAEIGGCNALTAALLAAYFQLPMVDGDLIGRAFPYVHMCKPAALGLTQQKVYMGSNAGEVMTTQSDNMLAIEKFARSAAIKFGGSAGIGVFLFLAKHHDQYMIEGSFSKALHLGKNLYSNTDAKIISEGIIQAVHHYVRDGFLFGSCIINNNSDEYAIGFQNEFLFLRKNDQLIIETPEIIVIMDQRHSMPLTSDNLQTGLTVTLLSLPAPEFWKTPEMRSLVNLDQFSHLF